ncbi:hypothetical protein BKH46_09100 [Helicobacter sp. 12S02634-8]|uniref:hypothetical protein n=1 Tax=Helicobacter sp. 12S02634-8 TaxID=1476199 RepID=UPI000BA7D0DD|nr:hypothetical protein [Helicobacter sp. 12S02634-8]PAF46101.1 hypothetical protein BKH46_09100 [Helicobacter sp. 12S02634-8]
MATEYMYQVKQFTIRIVNKNNRWRIYIHNGTDEDYYLSSPSKESAIDTLNSHTTDCLVLLG